jgi:hypothetical protein
MAACAVVNAFEPSSAQARAETEDGLSVPSTSTFRKQPSLICAGAWRPPAGLTGKPSRMRGRSEMTDKTNIERRTLIAAASGAAILTLMPKRAAAQSLDTITPAASGHF